MTLRPEACYQAVLAHDRRFDGLFFTCVSSTGIYCRPVCTAVTPKPGNCSFVRSAPEAEALGFRPCLRCRPEYAPGTLRDHYSPAQTLAKHIDETLMSDETIGSFADSLTISERQLRRLFKDDFGLEPHQYLISRRLLFAKQLLQDTRLPVAQVAFAAGFGSIGRLTIQMKRLYGFTPQQFRKANQQEAHQSIELKTAYRPPFDWQSTLDFLAGRATPYERVEDGVYYRVLADGLEICVRNDPAKSLLAVTIPAEATKEAYRIVRRVRALFDLDAEPQVVYEALSHNQYLSVLANTHKGIRVPGCWDPFEMVLRVIIGQQVSVAGATTIMRRLIDRLGTRPEAIAASSIDEIAGLGMPGKRAQTILTVSKLAADGKLNLQESNPVEFYNQLVAIPGIGPWTGEYLKMRVLRWPDALPADDLGLQKALIPGQKVTKKILESALENTSPWRSYATVLLWKSLENNGG